MSLGPYTIDDIYHADCVDAMCKIPESKIDLIVADPPFGIGFTGHEGSYGIRRDVTKDENILEYREVPQDQYYDFSMEWIKQALRILKPHGTMYVFSGWTNLEYVLKSLRLVGSHIQSHMIWHYNFPSWTSRRFASSHYHILHVTKDKDEYTFNLVEPYPQDVWIIDRDFWSKRIKKTATKLPISLVEKLIRYSSNVDDLVLDPFIGSGTTAIAAKMHNRHYIGFEIVEETYEVAKERIDSSPWGVGDFFE